MLPVLLALSRVKRSGMFLSLTLSHACFASCRLHTVDQTEGLSNEQTNINEMEVYRGWGLLAR